MASGNVWSVAWLLAAAVSSAAAQTPNLVWESAFDQSLAATPQIMDATAPGSFVPASIHLTPAPAGDYYLHAPDWIGRATVSRLSADDDSTNWQRIASGDRIYMGGMRLIGQSTADGDAWVVAGGVVRFSADGEFLWSRAAEATSTDGTASIYRLSDGDLLTLGTDPSAAGRARLSRIDASTGALVDGFVLPLPQNGCRAGLLGTDPADALYMAAICLESGQEVTTVSRLAPDLSIAWTHALPAGASLYFEAGQRWVDAAALYLMIGGPAGPALMRLSAADGSQSWLRPGVWTDLRLDGSGRLLASFWSGASHRVDLIDPANGQSIWTYEMAARDVHIDVAADGLYLAGTDEDQTRGVAERLDPETGGVVWRRMLAGPTTGGQFRPEAVLATTAAVRVAGADCLPEAECRIGVVRIDRATGAASPITYPAVPQTARGAVVADGEGHVLAYALEPIQVDALTAVPPGQQVRVRRIDTAGVVEWERVWPIGTLQRLDLVRVMRAGDGDLLLAVNTSRTSSMPDYGYPYIAKYSGADGQLRWEKRLLSGVHPGAVDFAVDSDPAGNVFLGESSMTYQGSTGGYVFARSFSRLDAGSGEIQWTESMRPSASSTLLGSAPYFRTVQNDVLLFESPEALPAGAIVRLSGASGAVVWTSTELATSGADLIVSDAEEGFMRDAGNGVKAFSLASGTVHWTYRYADPAAAGGAVLSGAFGDDGDVYFSGSRANGSGWTARVARDSGAPVWVDHFDAAVGAVHASTIVRDAQQGHVHVTQRRRAELFLTRLDQQTGTFVDSTLLSRWSLDDETIADDGAAYLRRMPDGQILAPGTAYRPGESLRPWAGRLAAPSAGVSGNLALSLAVSPAVAAPAEARTLTVPIAYSGDGAISGAIALVALDAAVTGRNDRLAVDALDCTTTGGGHCSAVATPTGIRLHLDLAPGATATLTAQLRALAPSSVVSAKVHAPYGLFESDMLDNEVSVAVSADRLFADDFE